jgi:TPR repeat protein
MALRFVFALVLSSMCLTISACAYFDESPSTSPPGDEYEALAKELRKSAKEGNAGAQNELGLLYNEGHGVPQDYGQAKHWFEKAVKQGHVEAQVNLGMLYLLGQGASQSDQMALFWFRQAAKKENALAFANLGVMYSQGRGVPQDLIQAHMWYSLAAAHGEKSAFEFRDALATNMTPAQIAEAQKLAREWKPKKS